MKSEKQRPRLSVVPKRSSSKQPNDSTLKSESEPAPVVVSMKEYMHPSLWRGPVPSPSSEKLQDSTKTRTADLSSEEPDDSSTSA